MKYIAIFGGAETKPGEKIYQDAYELGKLLAESGYIVLNGGYMGVMEAVSKGAVECGGHVIGVTCDEIETWRPVAPNPWIREEIRFPTLRQRLFALIDRCDAAIVFPGGIGTLGELVLMWSQLLIGAIPTRPLIVIGDEWNNFLHIYYNQFGDYINEKHRHWIIYHQNIHQAFQFLEQIRSTKNK